MRPNPQPGRLPPAICNPAGGSYVRCSALAAFRAQAMTNAVPHFAGFARRFREHPFYLLLVAPTDCPHDPQATRRASRALTGYEVLGAADGETRSIVPSNLSGPAIFFCGAVAKHFSVDAPQLALNKRDTIHLPVSNRREPVRLSSPFLGTPYAMSQP